MVGFSGKVPFELRRPGGDFDKKRLFNVPGVVLVLAVLTIFAFLALYLVPVKTAQALALAGAVVPKKFMAGAVANGGWLSMFSPLVSHIFIHAGIMHIVLNSVWMVAFGAPVARRMGAIDAMGSFTAFARAGLFVTFYLLCGVAGALTFIAMHTDDIIPMVGASGAVSGLLGGLVRFAFNRSTLFGPEHATLNPLGSQPVMTWSFFIIVMNVGFGVFGGSLTGGGMVAWEAHLGGYVFGLLTYPLFERFARGLGSQ